MNGTKNFPCNYAAFYSITICFMFTDWPFIAQLINKLINT